MTVTLPQQFQDTMRELLAEEYQDYIKSMEEPRIRRSGSIRTKYH
ncbi:hypothetical protein [Roseburia sp. AM59-24XD]|nr:hypothetical protein [Roseburia sp. AM59-24XD]